MDAPADVLSTEARGLVKLLGIGVMVGSLA